MTVCIDLSAAAHERAGLGRYAASLAEALLALDPALTGFVNDLSTSRLRAPLSALPLRTAGLPRKLWRLRAAVSYFGGPKLDQALAGVSLYHATEHLLPYISTARSVFTLHDVAYRLYPQFHLWQNRLYLNLMMPRFMARADAVICVSEATRRDAERFYRVPPEKLHVIYEGVEPRFQPATDAWALEAVRRRYSLPQRFILCVCTIEPRKNLTTLLDAYAALRQRQPEVGLVLAGGRGWLYEDFFTHLRRQKLEQVVHLPGYIPDADLPALMNCAEVFAYPSVFEGFGLPPLEAMACGIPVICSAASSLPEVVADAGLLLPAQDPGRWTEALARLLADPELHADLRARGLNRARQFTWARAAEQTQAVYHTVLKNR